MEVEWNIGKSVWDTSHLTCLLGNMSVWNRQLDIMSRVQGRSLGLKYNFGSHQHIDGYLKPYDWKIIKGVNVDRQDQQNPRSNIKRLESQEEESKRD